MNTATSLDLYTPAQIRQLEQQLLATQGYSVSALMQRAATAAWRQLRLCWPALRRLLVCCGPGHNGGDGLLLAALAAADGVHVEVIALAGTGAAGEAAKARQAALAAGASLSPYVDGMVLPAADVYVDALYGIGLNRPLAAPATGLVAALNAQRQPVLALDVPSGLDAATGQVQGVAVRACATVTFIAAKTGLLTGQAADYVGELYVDDLSLSWPKGIAAPAARRLGEQLLPPRARAAHKGLHGHVLVVGGDHGLAGAVQLAGAAALRSGAGRVSVATRAEHVSALNARWPELMAGGVDGPSALLDRLSCCDVLAVGPGLGQAAWGHGLWLTALDSGKPLVLDADALNLLAQQPQPLRMPAVITPHPGEAGRLLGVTCAEVEADRYAAVRALAQRYQTVVVLKGAGSLIAAPDGGLRVCAWGNPGMAVGGMGDLLTGCIAALLAQGSTPWQAACQGVGAHARAGDAAAAAEGERGLLPSDLLPWLRRELSRRELHGAGA